MSLFFALKSNVGNSHPAMVQHAHDSASECPRVPCKKSECPLFPMLLRLRQDCRALTHSGGSTAPARGTAKAGSYRKHGSTPTAIYSGHRELPVPPSPSCEDSFLCSCTILSCSLLTHQGPMRHEEASFDLAQERCCGLQNRLDDASRSRAETK